MNKSFFVLVIAFLLVPAVPGQKNPGSNLPSYVHGTWLIARYTDRKELARELTQKVREKFIPVI